MKQGRGQQPEAPHRRSALLLAACALLAALALAPAASAAQPPLLRSFCATGSAGGQCVFPRGVAADPESGDVYVANQNNRRIEKFSAWGQFRRAWGWDVVAGNAEEGFEVCVAGADVCKGGLTGAGAGEFGNLGPQGLALDSAGDLYVVDWSNRRVQKFSPEGQFLLMFGGEVDKTEVALREHQEAEGEAVTVTEAQENLCTAASGHQCGAGTEGTGQGQFGQWRLGSYIAVDTKNTPEASDDVIYVGDVGRVQEFDAEGHYLEDLPDPDGVLAAGGTVDSLALDPGSGDLYLGFFRAVSSPESKPDIDKLSPEGEEECTITAHNPTAITVAGDGSVYVVDGHIARTPPTLREIARFDSDCGGREVLFGPEAAESLFTANPTGIAISSACRAEDEAGTDLIVSNPDEAQSFVRLFGPPPDATLCPPPPADPLIADQYASSVGSHGAVVKAAVNPRFWPDTTYRVQYATLACLGGETEEWGAGCVQETTETPLTEQTVSDALPTKGVLLGAGETLSPATAYRYRFVAKSSGGGPVYGLGGGEEEGGEYRELGSAGEFRTYPSSAPAKGDCPNQAYRTGPSATLPDCRAYEQVSPQDKNNGDLAPPRPDALDQAATDGEAVSFAALNAFAEPEGAPFLNQYLSQREAGGWSARSINAPRSSVPLIYQENLATRFKAFSADLCSGWTLQDTDVPLVGGEVPRGVAGLYRSRALREGCAGPGGYELLSTIFPPGYDPKVEKTETKYYPQLQGFSADGQTSVFRAAAALSPNACKVLTERGPEGAGIFQVYLSREGRPGTPPTLLSVLPSGAAACTHSSLGISHSFNNPDFNASQDGLHNALSEDGERAYWTATPEAVISKSSSQAGEGPGRLYVRLHPSAPPSPLADGAATGTGDLIGKAEGEGKVFKLGADKEKVTKLKLSPGSGQFAVGQEVSDAAAALPAATKVIGVEEEPLTVVEEEEGKEKSGRFVLTLDHAATGNANPDLIVGHGSEVLTGLSTSTGAFAAGQTFAGPGIPFATTILSCSPECGAPATSLTLSAKATASGEGVAIEAFSPCTEPEAKACTIPVSEEAETLSHTNASRFLDAAADGSAAYFATGNLSGGDADLYRFDLARALAHEAPDSPIAHQVSGILGASEDGSTVYLVSSEVCSSAPNSAEQSAVEGEPNLYRYQAGESCAAGQFEFIATLNGPNDTEVKDNVAGSSALEIAPANHLSRVAPDGQSAAFVSADPALAHAVAHYDNADAASGEPDREVYLYRAATDSLICASCNPSGARPVGRAERGASDLWTAAQIPGWATAMHPGGALSADGSRIFFESFEPLVPRDTNGVGDVYEWEAASSEADCLNTIGGELYEGGSGGCLSLISSGRGVADSLFVDASADGRDAFIFTNDRLAPTDSDGFQDIYDAREGGGFSAPPAPAAPCEGEACQSPAPPPQAQSPASAAFRGPGNLTEAPERKSCPKGRRRVKHKGKVRCVKRHRHRAHHRHRRAAR